jgi:endonuclease III
MIDPTKITNYNLTQAELEEHLLFWVFAAGHNAKSTAKGVDKFKTKVFALAPDHEFLFGAIYALGQTNGWDFIRELLGSCGLGCWRRKSRTVRELCLKALHLKTCTRENLESIWGIGEKTSKCFLLHSRPGIRFAGLDTHIRKFLREKGFDVPNALTKKRYQVLEQEFLKLCDEVGKTPADYDLELWNKYANK